MLACANEILSPADTQAFRSSVSAFFKVTSQKIFGVVTHWQNVGTFGEESPSTVKSGTLSNGKPGKPEEECNRDIPPSNLRHKTVRVEMWGKSPHACLVTSG